MRDYASLYSDLLDDLAMQAKPDGHIFSDMSTTRSASVALANSFYKKLLPLGDTTSPDRAALEKFESINARMGGPEWRFDASSEAESCFYDYFKDHLRVALEPHEELGSFSLDSIREHMGVGPGAAQKADSRCMTTKLFESSLSYANPDLIRVYRSALAGSGLWAEAEMLRFERFGFTRVSGGKIFFAEKNAEISRTCCTEPVLEMLFQKACGGFIEERLLHFFGISLSRQPDFNRELARIGSLDGSFGTQDLVSASDSIMLQLCKDALPDGALKRLMMMCRCVSAVLPDGREVELKMMSTMGNGFTFPLQTLIFACAVRACYNLLGIPCRDPKTQYGVFGDDICVRREAYTFVSRMLTKLGFEVNVAKSFNSGPFRESCGYDYVSGYNIRGVYVKSLETPQQVYSVINRLTRWSANHDIPLTKTIKTLISWVRDLRIPLSESDDAGIKVPFRSTIPKLSAGYWFKYRYYKRRVSKLDVPEPGISSLDHNELGLAVGFLAGHIRRPDVALTNLDDTMWKHDVSLRVPIRDKAGVQPRYQVVSGSIPFWDYLPDPKMASWSDSGHPLARAETPRQVLTDLSHARWKRVMTAILP